MIILLFLLENLENNIRLLRCFEVAEDIAPMTEILAVKAKDIDSERNAKITFRFAEEIPEFGIHPRSGSVFVKMALDREIQADYHLTLIATDSGKVSFPNLIKQVFTFGVKHPLQFLVIKEDR